MEQRADDGGAIPAAVEQADVVADGNPGFVHFIDLTALRDMRYEIYEKRMN